MSDCPFCQLLASGNPGSKLPHLIADTGSALALLNRAPLAPGHLTLVFKAHHTQTSDLRDVHLAGAGEWLGRLSAILEREFAPQRVILLGDGKRSAHLHWHLVPEPLDAPLDPGAAVADLTRPARPNTLGDADVSKLVTRLRDQLR
jgi:Diadenosine tetraphosphate (Ap4A) hydrolase and other HIT family hydrolases